MSIRNAMMCACVIMGSAIIPAIAHADADLIVNTAPPAPKTEIVPGPRTGYVWSPGYWKWENNEHVWVEGRWIEQRKDAHWIPDRWTQDPNDPNHWHFRPGHWEEG
jgi:hypothetical protein